MTLQERKERWERELSRMSGGNRWGESRRFAGRSAGIRFDRRRWLISHISAAETKLTANAEHEPRAIASRAPCSCSAPDSPLKKKLKKVALSSWRT